jgi:iron complex transport system substrate-binding protein
MLRRARRLLFLLSIALVPDAGVVAEPIPRRVVSINVCADQLAMLIAAEGQLHSVSKLAADPAGSVLSDKANHYVLNAGFAEEVFMMHPDLVLAGTYTARTSVAMLRRLGVRVVDLPPTNTFDEIRQQIRHVGHLLGREPRAEELVAALDADLAALPPPQAAQPRPLAVLHYFNNYTSGAGTLAGEVVTRAGFRNLGSEIGLVGTVHLPLERLVMAAPDVVIAENKTEQVQILAYDGFDHPALRAVTGGKPFISIPDKYWVCGAPFTAEAVRRLAREATMHRTGPR